MEEEGPSYIVVNLQWKIVCKQTAGGDYLGLFVEAENPSKKSDDWNCEAEITLNVADKESGHWWRERFSHEFSHKNKVGGVELFKEWDEVIKHYHHLKVYERYLSH